MPSCLLAFGRASVAYSTFSPGVGRAHRGFSLHTGDAVKGGASDGAPFVLESGFAVSWQHRCYGHPQTHAATALPSHAAQPRVKPERLVRGRRLNGARQRCASDKRGAKEAVCPSRFGEPAQSRFLSYTRV